MAHRLFVVALMLGLRSGSAENPIGRVANMLSSFQNSVIKEGREAQSMYTEFAAMCEDRSRELHTEIKTSKAKSTELTASIEKAVADGTVLDEKISDAADGTADADAELRKATELRAKEHSDFTAEQAELQNTISTIERSITLMERKGSGASLAQLQSAHSITQVLQTMAEAEAINSDDAAQLSSLIQSSQVDQSSEEDVADAEVRESKGGNIVDTLDSLLDKTQKQLEDARNGERNALNSYEMVKMSLQDKIKTMKKEMAEAKKTKAGVSETQATGQGNLEVTNKDHSEDEKELAELHRECLDRATAFEESTSERNDMLKALAEAKKIIAESTGAAADQTYGSAASFVQVAATSTSASSQALHMVRRMALDDHSQALIELANHIETSIRSSSKSGADPFGKVKRMIESMINKLATEAESEAKKKDYCDKEMAETKVNKDDKQSSIDNLKTQVDVVSSAAKTLKSDVAVLEKELGALAGTQAEMDKLRMGEKALYSKNKPVIELGLAGVQKALKVLRDYFAQDGESSSGAASGIIGMMEVIESDFSKGLAEITSSEESAASEYQKATEENKVARAEKSQAAKYKTAEFVSMGKTISELKSDKSGVRTELDAVNEYFASLNKECIAAPSSYEERKERRDKQIAGLKEAMGTLEGDAVLLQRKSAYRTLRGGKLEAVA